MSVVLRLAGEEPYECTAVGESYMRGGVEDVVFCFMRFPSGLAAHLHLSWLDPHKERRFTVVGSKKMATFDDMELERKLTVYDKGFDEDFTSYGEYIARSGDVYSPRVRQRRAAADRVRALRGLRARGRHAALRRRERPARGARARGAAGLARLRAAVLRPSDRAPGLLLGEGVALPPTVELGGNVVIHEGTRDRRRARGSRTARSWASRSRSARSRRRRRDAPAPAEIGAGATVCAGAVVVAGARIGDGAVVGDQAHVRERAVVGEGSVVGRGSAVDNDVTIGARVRIQTGCYITAFSAIEDDVFVAPGRHAHQRRHDGPPRAGLRVARRPLRRACRVGGGVVLTPGVEVGRGGVRGGGRGGGARRPGRARW